MTVTINGKSVNVQPGSLDNTLKAGGFADGTFATAVNGTFVPKEQRKDFSVSEGDEIEVLTARQGG
ncbi:MAG: sulfur carrier protein ThiS [Pseudomonadota bacterium]